ncbi:MAG TPA: exo-beta-N-acetylmuramidase NamZ domain-containing protein [Ignavibacteriales bacterium]|nr:exo-beta-N-acetylmuramidase NamZ domain-containing protein [Ignavibacteriales bacterium]
MKKLLVLAIILAASITLAQQPKVLPGIETLKKDNFKILEGKRVGLITNPTGMDVNLKSTVDVLFEAKNVNLTALYGPEHGVRGDYAAGDYVEFFVDEYTNLPVYSLHGNTLGGCASVIEAANMMARTKNFFILQ